MTIDPNTIKTRISDTLERLNEKEWFRKLLSYFEIGPVAGEANELEEEPPATERPDSAPPVNKPASKGKAPAPMMRPARLTSRFYFVRAQQIWHWTVLSLPLDLLILLPGLHSYKGTGIQTPLVALALFLVFTTVIFLARDQIVALLLTAGDTRAKLFSFASKYSLAVIAIAVLGIFIEVAHKIGEFSLFSLALAVVVSLGAIKSIRKTMAEQREHRGLLERDRTMWVEHTNHKIFLLAVIPIATARLVSTSGGVAALIETGSPLIFAAWLLLSAVLLFSLAPQQGHFMMTCKSCGIRTSVILKQTGICPLCDLIRTSRNQKG